MVNQIKVCVIWHTVHSEKLFLIREHNRNGSTSQDMCDTWQTGDSDELFVMKNYNTDG